MVRTGMVWSFLASKLVVSKTGEPLVPMGYDSSVSKVCDPRGAITYFPSAATLSQVLPLLSSEAE